MNEIRIENLSKHYGEVRALDDVSLTFEAGKIYGLLGRNGAGKTTLLNTISNRIFPEAGSIVVDGIPARENDAAQGLLYMMSEQTLYPETMRVAEVFQWTGVFYGDAFDAKYAEELCGLFALDPKKKLKQLSTGYRSIFKIVTALSLSIPYLLLDEPVLGLDANHRELFYRLLLESYATYPRAFVLSTHLIEEVAPLIEEVVILKEGRIIVQSPCEELLRSGYAVSGPAGVVDAFAQDKECIGEDVLGGLKTVYIRGQRPETLPQGIEASAMDLQKLFIRLTNV